MDCDCHESVSVRKLVRNRRYARSTRSASNVHWFKKQRLEPPLTGYSSGCSLGQRSKANEQRGWKRQPLGGRAGDGTSPPSGTRTGATRACETRGIEAKSA